MTHPATSDSPAGTRRILTGRATAEGTGRFAARHGPRFVDDFFRPLGRTELQVSSVGFGSYLGDCTGADDDRVASTAHEALTAGVNLLDTAINYRCQRAERALGEALAEAVRNGDVARDEVVVCTKGGYIPLDGTPPESRDAYRAYLATEYFDRGIMAPTDVVAGGHCLSPDYLNDQLRRSHANLGVEVIDLYYLHNPEQQLDALAPDELRPRLRDAFALLEERCAEGSIGAYGCATWDGLRTLAAQRGHLSLADLVEIASSVAGRAHHFAAVQLPINLAMTESVRTPTQQWRGVGVTVLQAAAELGVAVVASASLMQGKLTASLPSQIHQALPGLSSDAQRAIAFVRSLPVVSSALVGMKSRAHLDDDLGGVAAR